MTYQLTDAGERRAQPAGPELLPHVPRLWHRAVGCAHAGRAPTRWPTSGSTCRCGAWRCSSRRASTGEPNGWCSSRTTSRCGRRSGSTSARSCRRYFLKGAFQGQTADQAYFVKCDSETTTQADIDQRDRQHPGRFRAAEAGRVRRHPDRAADRSGWIVSLFGRPATSKDAARG